MHNSYNIYEGKNIVIGVCLKRELKNGQQNKLYRRMFCTLSTFRRYIVQWPENWEKREMGRLRAMKETHYSATE